MGQENAKNLPIKYTIENDSMILNEFISDCKDAIISNKV